MKYVKLSGQLLDAPETDGETTAIQAWHDVENYTQNFIAHTLMQQMEFRIRIMFGLTVRLMEHFLEKMLLVAVLSVRLLLMQQ